MCKSDLSVDKSTVRRPVQTAARRRLADSTLSSSTATSQHGKLEHIDRRAQNGYTLRALNARCVARSAPDLKNATCVISWEVDGRKPLKSEGKRATKQDENIVQGLTRRLRLRWCDSRMEDAHVILVAREKYLTTNSDAHCVWDSSSLFFRQGIERAGKTQARAKSWLDLYRQKHCISCTGPNLEAEGKFRDLLQHSYFRVIDVLNLQLTDLSIDPLKVLAAYIALCYVWGKV